MEESSKSEAARRKRKGIGENKMATRAEAEDMLDEMAKTKEKRRSQSTVRTLSGRGRQIDSAVDSMVPKRKR